MVLLNVNSWRLVGGLPGWSGVSQLQFIFQPWKEQMCSDLTPVEQQQGSVTFSSVYSSPTAVFLS